MWSGLDALQSLVIPDPWQREAITALQQGASVVLDAPTGAGKTLVFEHWHRAASRRHPAFYTVPTRALANDKFREWRAAGWHAGIMTGDLTLDPDAPVVVATLESLLGRMHRGLDASLVVVDEYQWLADPGRGRHYEALLMLTPPTVPVLLMSGSVANPGDVASWLDRLGRRVVTVRHAVRPVPIEEADLDELGRHAPRSVTGFWSRRLAGALRDDLGPVLVFAPHRRESERLARQLARELPPCDPLTLDPDQLRLAGPDLAKLLAARVAHHHSGLDYAQRAALVEPLAKAGQLRIVVATLGLGAGINFSLRSVVITSTRYHANGLEREVAPHELLQMIGRAGRRGRDDTGYFLVAEDTPRLDSARPLQLKRAAPLPWSVLLHPDRARIESDAADAFARSLFQREPLRVGNEQTRHADPAALPCGQATDTGRARLVRRAKRPFKACRACARREECLALDPAPTLLWEWQRLRLLDFDLRLTPRGAVAACFPGPEGLALAAALEDPGYDVEELLFDSANLFAGDRFVGDEARWGGRLASVCRAAYRDFSLEGHLVFGVPPGYGSGASERLQQLLLGDRRRGQVTGGLVGVGDVDRLLVEWRSLLRQIAAAPDLDHPQSARWRALRDAAGRWLERLPPPRAITALADLMPARIR